VRCQRPQIAHAETGHKHVGARGSRPDRGDDPLRSSRRHAQLVTESFEHERVGTIVDERPLAVQVDDEQGIGTARKKFVDGPPEVAQHAPSAFEDAASDVRGNGLPDPAKTPGVAWDQSLQAAGERKSGNDPARCSHRQRAGVRARNLTIRCVEMLDVGRQAVVRERHVDDARTQPLSAQAETVLDRVRVPGKVRGLGQPFAVENAAWHNEEHFVDGIDLDGSVGVLAEQGATIPDPTDEPSSALHPDRSHEPDAVIGFQDRRRPLKRRERVQHDILVHEHEMIMSRARCADVESCAR